MTAKTSASQKLTGVASILVRSNEVTVTQKGHARASSQLERCLNFSALG